MRCTGVRRTRHGHRKPPCTAISSRKAVTFSGNSSPAARRRRSVHSCICSLVAAYSRATAASSILCVSITGDSLAACKISSEYALPMPLNSVGSVSARFSVWFSRRNRAANCGRTACSISMPPRILLLQRLLAVQKMERRASLGARLGEGQRAVGELKPRQHRALGQARTFFKPVQAARDHQVEDQPIIALEPDGDTLADPPHLRHATPAGVLDRRRGGAQEKRRRYEQMLQRLPDDPSFEGFTINGQIWKLGHKGSV